MALTLTLVPSLTLSEFWYQELGRNTYPISRSVPVRPMERVVLLNRLTAAVYRRFSKIAKNGF